MKWWYSLSGLERIISLALFRQKSSIYINVSYILFASKSRCVYCTHTIIQCWNGTPTYKTRSKRLNLLWATQFANVSLIGILTVCVTAVCDPFQRHTLWIPIQRCQNWKDQPLLYFSKNSSNIRQKKQSMRNLTQLWSYHPLRVCNWSAHCGKISIWSWATISMQYLNFQAQKIYVLPMSVFFDKK